MKMIVSGQVWFQKDFSTEGLVSDLRESLTVERQKVGDFGDDDGGPELVRLYSETDSLFGIPRGYFFSSVAAPHTYQWRVSEGHPMSVTNTIRHEGLYAEQGVAIDHFLKMFQGAKDALDSCRGNTGLVMPDRIRALRDAGAVLQAKTAWGKTAWALGLAARVGVTTLIVVHKEFLMNQWVKRIRKFLPDAKVGIIREGTCDFEGRDFVVAMVHSLALDDMTGSRYPAEIYDYFGMVITDECHRIAAQSWSSIPMRFSALYRVGVSATPRRKDGTERVFKEHIGDVRFAATSPALGALVRVKKYVENFGSKVSSGDLNSSIVLNIFTSNRNRNRFISDSIMTALQAPQKRKVLVLSHRLEQLEEIEELVMRMRDLPGDVTVGHYTGSWFTGDDKPVLKPGKWSMEGDGREKAILSIYQSLHRRKHGRGEIVDAECSVWVDSFHGCPGGKLHIVELDEESLSVVLGATFARGPRFIALEMLTDDELFSLAAYHKVRQTRKRGTRLQSEEDLYLAETSRLILATYQMAEEGVDLPPVDTLILASPQGDIEQTIGRGRRYCVPVAHGGVLEPEDCRHYCPWRWEGCKGKARLAVLDVVDVGVDLSEKRMKYRLKYYRSEGFRVLS